MNIMIAHIYNDVDDVEMEIRWNSKTGEITYITPALRQMWSAGESAKTLRAAVDDIYKRYGIGWDLCFADDLDESLETDEHE